MNNLQMIMRGIGPLLNDKELEEELIRLKSTPNTELSELMNNYFFKGGYYDHFEEHWKMESDFEHYTHWGLFVNQTSIIVVNCISICFNHKELIRELDEIHIAYLYWFSLILRIDTTTTLIETEYQGDTLIAKVHHILLRQVAHGELLPDHLIPFLIDCKFSQKQWSMFRCGMLQLTSWYEEDISDIVPDNLPNNYSLILKKAFPTDLDVELFIAEAKKIISIFLLDHLIEASFTALQLNLPEVGKKILQALLIQSKAHIGPNAETLNPDGCYGTPLLFPRLMASKYNNLSMVDWIVTLPISNSLFRNLLDIGFIEPFENFLIDSELWIDRDDIHTSLNFISHLNQVNRNSFINLGYPV